tara:strand:- start:37 stop:195 length:159 start_codon:yes stop_codon:yes gene_type:complete
MWLPLGWLNLLLRRNLGLHCARRLLWQRLLRLGLLLRLWLLLWRRRGLLLCL